MEKYLLLHNFVVLCILLSMPHTVSAGTIEIKPHVHTDAIFDDEVKIFIFNVSLLLESHEEGSVGVKIVSTNTEVATVTDEIFIIPENKQSNITVTIYGSFLGETALKFLVNKSLNGTLRGDNLDWYDYTETYKLVVKRDSRPIDTAFTVSIIILVCLANVAMGCKTDLAVVKSTLKRPIAPLTGLASQFVLMPLIAFSLGLAFKLDAPLAFGLFAMGCSPGGAASNIYTHLLDGDVSLSVTMTFVSTVASLGFIPMWLYSLGINYIYKEAGSIKIPYQNIITSLLGLLVPVGIGILIQKKKPNWAKNIVKCVPYVTALFLVFVFTVGVYANLYIFRVMTPVVLLSGALAPYLGFAFGALVAFIARQSKKNILTIAIETGIQNTGIAIVLLKVSLPSPDSDISITPPITSAIFTPIPMVIAIIIHMIRKRMQKKTLHQPETNVTMLDDTYPDNMDKNVVEMKFEEVPITDKSGEEKGKGDHL
ncbi:ileal sodium/bile acid cotransporter-like [Mytilus trossulus]|uniref:ileal sodium/bile acid cotransporter-like n=1 Tax=Mytilus trossulus TaxID=6551 RepID=UPI0030066D88